MPILDTVLFDNDGTLVDTYDLILESFHHAVRNVLGHDIADEKLMAKVGQPLATQMWDFTAIRRCMKSFCSRIANSTIASMTTVYRCFQVCAKVLSACAKRGSRWAWSHRR